MGVYFSRPVIDVKYRHGFKVDWYTYSNAGFGSLKHYIAAAINKVFTAAAITHSFTASAVNFSFKAVEKFFNFIAYK